MKKYQHYKGNLSLPDLIRSPVGTECTYKVRDITKLSNVLNQITVYCKRVGGKITLETLTTYPQPKKPLYVIDKDAKECYVRVEVVERAPVKKVRK